MQPTAGLGQTRPSPRRASVSAARMMRASPIAVPSVAFGGQAVDELAEILGLAEIAIDRSEAHVGHGIERRQHLHHQLADDLALDLGLAGAFELADDRVDRALDALALDRALAQRDLDRACQLVALERLALAVFLDHGELAKLHPLEGGEARGAVGTEPPPPDRGPLVGRPRVLHLGVFASAERTAHLVSLLGIDGEARAQRLNPLLDRRLDRGVAGVAVGGEAVENLDDQLSDEAEFRLAEAARRAGRAAETDARGDRRLLGIE